MKKIINNPAFIFIWIFLILLIAFLTVRFLINYRYYSNKLYNLFLSYTPYVQRFSIDESFLDMTKCFSKIEEELRNEFSGEKLQKQLQNVYISKAEEISEKIKNTWGYTVNIGIAHNKLLAKMASDLEKPDSIYT